MEPSSEMGTVTFPFRHTVMETGLLVNVSPSPVDTTCSGTVSEMAVIVSCSDLTNNERYTVTLRGTLSVEEILLPFTFSETLYPTAGLWLKGCIDVLFTSSLCGYVYHAWLLCVTNILCSCLVFLFGVITMSFMSTDTSTAAPPTTESPSSGELCYTLLSSRQFLAVMI